MTPEQLQHQEDYYIARRKYENAFSDKRHAENEISSILNRRQLVINSINELSAERKRNSDSHDQILKSYAKNGELDASVRDTEAKLEAGTIGFSGIGESTVGTPQNLTEVFDARNRVSKASITSAFSQLKNTEGMIQRKIDDLSRQITQLEKEFEDGQNRERYLNGVISEQNHIMNNASIEMAYHKMQMNG